jgi:chemotaxis-related protein WspB
VRTHALLFSVGVGRFAVPAAGVVEVVAAVPLRAVPGAVFGVVGLLAYRGEIVPVVDLPLLHGCGPCPPRFSSRIIVYDLGGRSVRWGERGVVGSRVGLLAEDVTRDAHLDPDAPGSHPGVATPGVPGLGRVVETDDGLVQWMTVEDLVSKEVLASLVRGAEAGAASGTSAANGANGVGATVA